MEEKKIPFLSGTITAHGLIKWWKDYAIEGEFEVVNEQPKLLEGE